MAKKGCQTVEAIDNQSQYVGLCKRLGIDTKLTTFRNYNPDKKFDRIMLGNVMHYMYRECGDWSFIIKLAAISTDLVLIEGPTGMNCKIMKDAIPRNLRRNFNDEAFKTAMKQFFTLVSISNSPSQGRYIMLWKRKPVPKEAFALHTGLKILKQDKESTVYESEKHIIKIQNQHEEKDEIRIFIASHSPISNGLKCLVYNYGKYQGWVEEKSDQKKLKPYTNQEQILQKLYLHNIYLAKLGFTEMDMGLTNFFPDLTMFDKGGVCHIQNINPLAINDIEKGWFFVMFRNQFNIPIDFEGIQKALQSSDSVQIQEIYESFMDHKKSFWGFRK